MARFSDKVAIITGSSNGIGRTTAVMLAKEGAKVTITGRNAERLEETKQQIIKAGVAADHVNSVVTDVTSDAGVDLLISSTIEKFGKLDILINNAGAAFADPNGRTGVDQSMDQFQSTFDLNVKSVLNLIQKAKPYLTQTRGEIVNVSSIAGVPTGHPTFLYYSMAKIALDQLTRGAALQLIPLGIRVNSVSPGVVVTGFAEAMGMSKEASDAMYKFWAENRQFIPHEEIGKPEDIANVILFLADRKLSAYIVGQSIVADGGSSLVLAFESQDLTKNL